MINWKVRYANILRNHPELFDRRYTVVEVGSGPFGIAQFLDRPVIGVEPTLLSPASEHLKIIEGSITRLPFHDQEIDIVVCVDALEHVPVADRKDAIHELVRVSRQKTIISCPCHKWAQKGEHALFEMFKKFQMPIPGWLEEHLELGLPEITEIISSIVDTGFKFEILCNETLLQHYSGIAMDWMYPLGGELNSRLQGNIPRTDAPIEGNEWDLCYSFIFNIYRQYRVLAEVTPPVGAASSVRQRFAPETAPPSLYAVYHSDFPTDNLGSIIPIFAGGAADQAKADQLTDRLYDGARLPNERWSELSAIYKIWQDGPRSPVVGFCHYRRFFDFRDNSPQNSARQTDLQIGDMPNYMEYFYDEYYLKSLPKNSLLVAKTNPVQSSIFEQYCEIHNTRDYLEIFNQIAMSESPLLPGMLAQFSTHMLYANNLFITSWDLFCEICGFWFEYLPQFARKIGERQVSPYQKRDVAFLAERIFDAWVRYRKDIGTDVRELPIFFFH